MKKLAAVGVSVALALVAGGFVAAQGRDGTAGVGSVSVTTLAGAKEPQAAVDSSGRIVVAFGSGDAVYSVVSAGGGRRFDAPVKVSEAGHLSLGMRRGPRVAFSGKNIVISAVYGRDGGGRDGELLAWHSADNGKTWRGPVTVSDTPGAAREGLHAMSAAPDGTLACAWLDLREKGTQIFASLSHDGGATWSKNVRVYRSPAGNVCECCHPSVAFDEKGNLLVMWRNWDGAARDMYLSRSADGGKTFAAAQKLGVGTWQLNACPMDGGAFAIARNGEVTTFWRRDGQMYLCAPGKSETRVGDGQQGWIADGPGGAYAVWLNNGRPGKLMAQTPGKSAPALLAEQANDPVIAAAPGGTAPVIAVWTGETGIRAAALAAR